MTAIEVLIKEHENISRLNRIIQSACLCLMKGDEVPDTDFEEMIDFIRHYADRHHHGKEEKFLFLEMEKHLGPAAEKLVKNGMLVEHDLARLHVSEWEAALKRYKSSHSPEDRLDIITYASGYAKLLKRHIDRENEVVYTFAQKQLKPEILEALNRDTEKFEKEAEKQNLQENYLLLLEKLEKKY